MEREQKSPRLKYELYFSDEVQNKISQLTTTHGLERDLTLDIFELMKTKDPEIVIFNAAKKIVAMEKGKNLKDISDMLKHELKIHQATADKLAHDIKNTIVPLVDITPAIEEAAPPEEKEEFEKAKEELFKKIRANQGIPEPVENPPMPYVKKIPITSVEENAENMDEMGQNTITRQKESILAKGAVEKKEEPQNKVADNYREPVE